MTVTDTSTSTFTGDWNAWHASRDATFGEPLGWLSLTALHWLVDTDSTFADLPGAWRADANAVVVTATPADDLSIDGVAVDGAATLNPIEGAPGLIVKQGARLVEGHPPHRRGGSADPRFVGPGIGAIQWYPDLRAEPAVAHRGCLHSFSRRLAR